MQQIRDVSGRLRFGVFEVDLRAGELRKHGVKLRLQEQPFQVLAMLLERPGETVTREELRNRLWTAETFVDFDHGVNKAVNRIRDALGDSATSPRFVETVARRGYRFIGTSRSERTRARRLRRPSTSSCLSSSRLVTVTTALVADADDHRLGLALTSVVLVAWMLRSHGPSPPIRSLAVLPLENLSGDASQEYFADGMTDQLIAPLGQISALRVISRTSVMRYKGTRKPLPADRPRAERRRRRRRQHRRSGDRVRITAQMIDARR